MPTPRYTYTAQFLSNLERTISRERLTRYLTATNQDVAVALELYEDNVAVSEALFGLLHGLEVTVRNSIHYTLTQQLGTATWYESTTRLPWSTGGEFVPFTPVMKKMIADAKRKAGTRETPGKVLAELPFGFWSLLLAGHFHQPLWLTGLYKAFPHANMPRRLVHWRLEVLRWVRNRIAHHEPVLTSHEEVYTGFDRQKYINLPQILECIAWVSADSAEWLKTQSRYKSAESVLRRISQMGISL